ncbi:MAG: hypothetical protein FRX49_09025 [Trebouxia sp. A1-2]|nr:MAG: hypothetical protein FRX49_09025 [Trebouxia sp. A1-2]
MLYIWEQPAGSGLLTEKLTLNAYLDATEVSVVVWRNKDVKDFVRLHAKPPSGLDIAHETFLLCDLNL